MIVLFDRFLLVPDSGAVLDVPLARGASLEIDEEVSVRGDGSEGVDSRRFAVEAETPSDTAAALVERWRASGVRVRALLVGLDGHAAWAEPVPVRTSASARGGRATWTLRLFTALRAARVHRGPVSNLLLGPFLPSGPSGYAAVDPVALTLAQSGLSDGDGLLVWQSPDVPCGPGQTVAASVVVGGGHTLSASEAALRVVAYTAAGAEITSGSTALGSGGAVSASLVTPAACAAVRWRLEVAATPVGGDLDVSTPCLRIAAPLSRTSVTTPVAY